jgi:hypothetical protein
MPSPQDGPDGLEAMAFQLLLHKVTSLERAMQAIPPLLTKIIAQLEAQAKPSDVPVATYAQLYPQLQEGTGEHGDVIEVPVETPPVLQAPRRPFWRWFTKETPSCRSGHSS